jgi:hypothetical protein
MCLCCCCSTTWVTEVVPLQSLVALEACYWSIIQGSTAAQQPGAAGRQATLKQKRKVAHACVCQNASNSYIWPGTGCIHRSHHLRDSMCIL